MIESISGSLVAAGPLGAIILGLGLAYWQQQRRFETQITAANEARVAAQEARVRDAQAVTEQLLGINERWLQSINDLSQAVNELRIVMQERKPPRREG